MRRFLPLLVASCLAAQTARPLPDRIPPRRSSQIKDGFGINSDLPRDPYLPWNRWWWTRMFDGGISFVRIGQYENSSEYTSWDWIERRRGDYSAPAELDDIIDSLAGNGIHILVQLAYGSPLYTSPAGKLPDVITPAPGSFHNPDRSLYSLFWPPETGAQIEAFTKYVRFLVDRYRGRVEYWELWNEPNIAYWNPRPSPEAYGRLAKAVIPVIKQADPEARFVFGALAGADIPFAQKALDACACASDIDVFSYHIYPDYGHNLNPEAVDDAKYAPKSPRRLREIVRAYPNVRPNLVFWNDEFNSIPSWIGSDESVQTKYLPRGLLYDRAQGVRTFIWLIAGATDGNELDDFGMVRGLRFRPDDFTPRPAWQAVEHTDWLFSDTHPDQRITIQSPDYGSLNRREALHKYAFRSTSGKAIVAYWLAAHSEPGGSFPDVRFSLRITGSDIRHPVLIDVTSGRITRVAWKPETQDTLQGLPLKDAVMAIADESYFDWPVLPEAPSGLTSKLQGDVAELSWELHGDSKSTLIERRAAAGEWRSVARLGSPASRYTDRDLPSRGMVSYRVRSINDAGESAYSNIVRLRR